MDFEKWIKIQIILDARYSKLKTPDPVNLFNLQKLLILGIDCFYKKYPNSSQDISNFLSSNLIPTKHSLLHVKLIF